MRVLLSTPTAQRVIELDDEFDERDVRVGEVRLDLLREGDIVPTSELGSAEWHAFWTKLNSRDEGLDAK